MDQLIATSMWKLFPFKSENRAWITILVKAYACCIVTIFCLACVLNAAEGDVWLKRSVRTGGQKAVGDGALDECFWFVATTMHGIGFGEFVPFCLTGRLIAMFCCMLGYLFTIFMMCSVLLSQLPGEKDPTLFGVASRMAKALWPSYSVFCALTMSIGSMCGPYLSKDHHGGWTRNMWPTGMYWAWTTVHRSPYGDIFPDTVFGRTMTVPLEMMAVLYVPYALACVAVRCPTLEQHREIVGRMKGNAEKALGSGYSQPVQASGASLEEIIEMQGGYVREGGDDDYEYDSGNGRTCLVLCFFATFIAIVCSFFGGTPANAAHVLETALELNLPPGIRYAADPVPEVVWTFWMQSTPLEETGLKYWNELQESLDVDVVLITPDGLEQYNKTNDPLHPALKYLVPSHKLDYLIAYMMHNWGGGYVDIMKRKDNSSWEAPLDYLASNDTYWMLGKDSGTPSDDIPCDQSNINTDWCKEMLYSGQGYSYADTKMGMTSLEHSKGPCCEEVRKFYNQSSGNESIHWPRYDAFIMRKETLLTAKWLVKINEHLDAKFELLKAHHVTQDLDGYPLRAQELRGEILSPLLAEYQPHIRFDRDLPI